MKIREGLSEKVRGMADLKINSKDRKKIIQNSYMCFRELKGFPEQLGKLIGESKEEKLSGKEAYLAIRKGLSKYEEKLFTQAQMDKSLYSTGLDFN